MQVINQGLEKELFNYLAHSIENTPYYQLLGLNQVIRAWFSRTGCRSVPAAY